jgi:hypothetical protein
MGLRGRIGGLFRRPAASPETVGAVAVRPASTALGIRNLTPEELSAALDDFPRGAGISYLRFSGWLRSKAAGRPMDLFGHPLPWYTYAAIAFLDGTRDRPGSRINRKMRVFEYGCGQSTLGGRGASGRSSLSRTTRNGSGGCR